MQRVITDVVPLIAGFQMDKDAERLARRGTASSLRAAVIPLGTKVIPYAAFLIVPMMTRMFAKYEDARGAPDDPTMIESMSREREEARGFLGQLLGNEQRSNHNLPLSIGDDIQLRKYHHECLDWLAFLNKYGLHGALCDDMGLRKTLMNLCIMTGDYVTNKKNNHHLPALVLCPSVVHYAGLPKARARMRIHISLHESALVVTRNDILGNDLRFSENVRWNYVVLDERHVIKNAKTKAPRAVRRLSSNHRLILTGTPIQNSVSELWAMFDFLMPGSFGDEKSFKETHAEPIMAPREGEGSEADQERSMAATEALHRQVLPFVLRRLKNDIIAKLPPKIMKDYYCNMTAIQLRLYEDFASEVSGGTEMKSLSGQKEIGHPKLVLSPSHPEYASVQHALKTRGQLVDDIESVQS
ncbi:Helicase 1/2 ATP-binding [Gracilaria domingensis]|nr:Helicase 1/2 ATP-binding [Gracilaria domingensis]